MVITRTTRNRLIGDEPVRGFESHPLRQKASNAFALLASFLAVKKPLADGCQRVKYLL